MAKKKTIEEKIGEAQNKDKMIHVVVTFNPKSKHHLDILRWIDSQQDNISAFGRELFAIAYDKSKQTKPGMSYEIVSEDNVDIDGMT
jgi:hypothetical protein